MQFYEQVTNYRDVLSLRVLLQAKLATSTVDEGLRGLTGAWGNLGWPLAVIIVSRQANRWGAL